MGPTMLPFEQGFQTTSTRFERPLRLVRRCEEKLAHYRRGVALAVACWVLGWLVASIVVIMTTDDVRSWGAAPTNAIATALRAGGTGYLAWAFFRELAVTLLSLEFLYVSLVLLSNGPGQLGAA